MKNKILAVAIIAAGVGGAPCVTIADTGCVAQAGQTPVSPYTNWTSAASNIQEAVAVAANTLVLVSNGTYSVTNQISITNAMVLRSVLGATNTIVKRSSGSTTRIFNISANAVIDGFTIRDGNSGNGGGVSMSLGTVQNCILVNNVSGAGPDGGGGIYMTGAGVISNCVFAGNAATVYDGGGVLMTAAGLIVNCIFANNTAPRWGGGIHFKTSAASGTLRNCLIASNSAAGTWSVVTGSGGAGGGVGSDSASPVIENCTIVSNVASGGGGGGGVYSGGGIRMTNTIVYFNRATTANNQSAIGNNLYGTMNAGYSCSPDLTAGTNGNITTDPQFMSVANSDFRLQPGSACIDSGSNRNWMTNGVDLAGNPRIQNLVVDMGAYEWANSNMPFQCNFRTVVSATTGLAVACTPYVSGPDTNITWCGWDFTNAGSYNQTVSNLAVVTNVYSDFGIYSIRLAMSNVTGYATSQVRTIYLYSTNGVAYVSTNGLSQWPYYTWAKAATNIQDAIDVAPNTLVLVSNGTYGITRQVLLNDGTVLRSMNGAANTIVKRSSGNTRIFSIFSSSAGTPVGKATIDGFTMRDVSFSSGDGNSGGGGVYMTVGTVQNCLVFSNSTTDKGGGVWMSSGVVSNCVFAGNRASSWDGGGIYMSGGLVVNCIVTNNTTARWGGGIHCNNSGTIRNCLIARNTAGTQAGGVGGNTASPTIESCTIVSNSAGTGTGGGIYGTARMTNTIVYFNTATTSNNLYGTITAGYSCCPDLADGVNGNKTANPQFANYSQGNYRLTISSPCVNTGTSLWWMTSSALDLDGQPRVRRSGTVDMGAYELPPAAGTVITIR